MKTKTPLREALTLTGPAGRLEALLDEPREIDEQAVAVLCHPHPQHHGTMLNKVVHTLARAMNELGVPALRFNFRGVGASDGAYANGIGETEDVVAVCRWARDRYRDRALWLGGFSFGAMVACRAAISEETGYLVSVAPPVARMGDLPGNGQPDCPWLIIQGEADEIVDCEEVIAWVNQLAPGPELVVLPDVGHFFHGRLTILRETVKSRLAKQAPAG